MKQDTIEVIINGETASAQKDQNLLHLLKAKHYSVPAPCYHPDWEGNLVCKLCLVNIGGDLKLACKTQTWDGMNVQTDSPEILNARKRNLKRLFDKHYQESLCADCIWDGGCELHQLAKEYGLKL